jgi:hypothetical protein
MQPQDHQRSHYHSFIVYERLNFYAYTDTTLLQYAPTAHQTPAYQDLARLMISTAENPFPSNFPALYHAITQRSYRRLSNATRRASCKGVFSVDPDVFQLRKVLEV